MDKKEVIFGLIFAFIFVLLLAPFVSAQENDAGTNSFASAYSCLEESVKSRGYSDLTSEEQAFSLLALAYDSGIQGSLRSALADSSNDGRCWPGDNCKLKETSIALIALDHIAQSTNLIESWLTEKTTEPNELDWFLQIDSSEKTTCTISYHGGSKKITIEEDKRITGAGGSCFSSALGGYWLKIDSDCYDDSFEISCDKAFISALAYKKSTGTDSPYFISSVTNSAPTQGKTTEKVNSLCFREKNTESCSFEGTLWSALALKKIGKDAKPYLPYLIALAPNYERYLPSSFLYMLTSDEEYFTELINNQKSEGYWQTSDSSLKYYDTALGLLALQGRSAEQATIAKDYLLETQPSSGCWNNIRDTAFILYTSSPKDPVLSSAKIYCEDSGYFCVSSEETCEQGNGLVQANYYCSASAGLTRVCCSVDVQEVLPDISPGGDNVNECEERGNYCKSFCNSETEEEKPYSCSGIESCCAPKSTEEGRSYWWVWLLIILIILLILAIIYRNQVKVLVFKIKDKFKKGPVTQQRRPPFPPFQLRGPGVMRAIPGRILPGRPMLGRPLLRGYGRVPVKPGAKPPLKPGQKPFSKENQLQETLKKLKEIGKR